MATARQDKTRTKPGPAKIPTVSDNTRLSLRRPEAAFPYGLDMQNPGASVKEMRRMKSPLISGIGEMIPASGQEILTEAAISGAMGPAMAVVPGAGHLLRNLLDLPAELKFFKALLAKVKDFPAHLEGRILIFKAQDVEKIAKALDDPKVGKVPESFTTDLKIFDEVATDTFHPSTEPSYVRSLSRPTRPRHPDSPDIEAPEAEWSEWRRQRDFANAEWEAHYVALRRKLAKDRENQAVRRMQKSTMTGEKQAYIAKQYEGSEVEGIRLRDAGGGMGQQAFMEKSFPRASFRTRSDPLDLEGYRSDISFKASKDYEKWLKETDPKLHKKMQDAFGDDVKNWMVPGGPGPHPPIPKREGGVWPDVPRVDESIPIIPNVSKATERSVSPKPIRRFGDSPEGPRRPSP